MTTRPRLTPAIADVRRAVRTALADSFATDPHGADRPNEGDDSRIAAKEGQLAANGGATPSFGRGQGGAPLVLVALSGGADSLALAAATSFEAGRAGIRAGAVVVDHGLQVGSADVAARAADQARSLGLDPVIVTRVEVGTDGGPEAAARDARYAALAEAAVLRRFRARAVGRSPEQRRPVSQGAGARDDSSDARGGARPRHRGSARPHGHAVSRRRRRPRPLRGGADRG